MSDSPQHRLFLERRSYQQRRLVDALRLLPILGLLLWLVPLIWARADDVVPAVSVVSASVFIFAVWVVLIVLGAFMSSRASFGDDPEAQDAAGDARNKGSTWNS
ncbi:MAG: hypothetical protein AAF891_05965 [Pseudomonadota bacterium]